LKCGQRFNCAGSLKDLAYLVEVDSQNQASISFSQQQVRRLQPFDLFQVEPFFIGQSNLSIDFH